MLDNDRLIRQADEMMIMLRAYSKVAVERFLDTFEQKILAFAQQLHRFIPVSQMIHFFTLLAETHSFFFACTATLNGGW